MRLSSTAGFPKRPLMSYVELPSALRMVISAFDGAQRMLTGFSENSWSRTLVL